MPPRPRKESLSFAAKYCRFPKGGGITEWKWFIFLWGEGMERTKVVVEEMEGIDGRRVERTDTCFFVVVLLLLLEFAI